MKISIVGLGYVGLSNAILLSQYFEVSATDIDDDKVYKVNNKISPIKDKYIEKYLKEKKLLLNCYVNLRQAINGTDFVVICTPTNYDEKLNFFDTQSVEEIIEQSIKINPDATIIIRSTIPVGFVDMVRKKFMKENIIFVPEFLREGLALFDILNPSRIIIGSSSAEGKKFSEILSISAEKKDVQIHFTGTLEAEAIKLFSNTYLAMRVAFFNELDSYALSQKMDTKEIIDGICLDERIGKHYNNPSFGYGGYCLPKDTKQLLANFNSVPQKLIQAIVDSNSTRKKFLADEIIKKKPNTVGIFRLIMKTESDNFRQSSIQGIIRRLKEADINVIIFEPGVPDDIFFGSKIYKDIKSFKDESDIIVANRKHSTLYDVFDKIYTRDIFGEN
jgi:UDPglucose 6-dehydrogenase